MMDYKALFKTAMLAGEIMAQSGAETFRVEDTMNRILSTSKLQSVQVYATTTGIVASLLDPTIEPISGVARINNRANNLSRIHDVNQISRNICDEKMTVAEAFKALEQIRMKKTYSKLTLAIATIISMVGFVGLFGGTLADCLIAFANGILIVLISKISDRFLVGTFMMDAAKCFAIAFFTVLSTHFFFPFSREIVIIGSIMPLVPGIPITNAVRDTLQGDYNSGTARAVEAFVISLGIALGVGAGMGFYDLLERMIIL